MQLVLVMDELSESNEDSRSYTLSGLGFPLPNHLMATIPEIN